MLKFNEEQQIKDIRGALALRSDVEKKLLIKFGRKDLMRFII